MKTNEYYSKTVGGNLETFIEFVKINNEDLSETISLEEIAAENREIDFLAQKIAQNMFYFEDNINTAKTDYITLLGLLIRKGVIFEHTNRQVKKQLLISFMDSLGQDDITQLELAHFEELADKYLNKQ